MKKICKFILFLILCNFLFINNSSALTDEILLKSRINLKHTYKFGNTTRTIYFDKFELKSNNHQIYNFNIPLRQEFLIYDVSEELPNINLSKNILSEIRKIVYYGDKKYNETKNDLYYIVTKVLMIKALNPISFTYFENSDYTNATISQAEDLLKKEINNYFLKPIFDNKEIELNLNEEITILDKNNILSSYLLDELESKIVSFEIVDNKIVLKGLKPGEVIFKLKKEFKDKNYNMEFLFKESNSSFAEPVDFAISSGNFTQYSEFKVKVNAGRIMLDIKDDKNISSSNKLNATYGIYNNLDELVYKIKTNVEGLFYTDYLPYGNYYVKELSNSDNYLKNDNVYKVNLDSNQDKVIVIKNHKKDLNDIKNELKNSEELREIKISFLDEEGRLIKEDVNISIMNKLYQINGKTSIILKDGNYLINILKVPDDYILENVTKIVDVNDNMELQIVLKHKEEGYGNEAIDVEVPDTCSFRSINYLFVFIGLRYVKKFSKW